MMAPAMKTEPRSESKMPAVTNSDKRSITGSNPSTSSLVQTTKSSTVATSSGNQEVTILKETTTKAQKKLQSLGGSPADASFSGLSIEELLDYIAAERLRHLPPRGSRWDRVLKYAVLFADEVNAYQQSVSSFLSHHEEAARLVWRSCRILLQVCIVLKDEKYKLIRIQMDHHQAVALEKVFGVFYNIGLSLSFFRQNQSLFNINGEIKQSLGIAFADVLALVVDIACFFQRQGKGMSGSTVTVDFDGLFGRSVDSFFARRDQVANEMWTYKLQQSTDLRGQSLFR